MPGGTCLTLCRQSVITKRDASIKLNGSGVRKRAGGTFSPRPGLRRSAGQIPNPPPQCVDKPQNVSFRASDPGRLLLPQKALLSLRDQSADWSWQSVGLLRQFTFCAAGAGEGIRSPVKGQKTWDFRGIRIATSLRSSQ